MQSTTFKKAYLQLHSNNSGLKQPFTTFITTVLEYKAVLKVIKTIDVLLCVPIHVTFFDVLYIISL